MSQFVRAVAAAGREGGTGMKNQKSEVKKVSCVDRNHAPLAVLALAAVFRELREQLGLSLNQLEKLSHVARQTLSSIEKQEYFPMAETIARVAEAMGFSFGEFGVKVDCWQARQPCCCRACRYSCMAEGRLSDLDSHRQCKRHQKAPSASPAISPIPR
jgi:transcriptional regulator with XRE-family HTH domain